HKQDDGVITAGKIAERLDSFWDDESRNLVVLVIPFKNRVPEGRQIGIAKHVTARILYQAHNADHWIHEMDRAAWLSEELNQVYFGTGDTRKLIIAALED